jgi:amino acid transporter
MFVLGRSTDVTGRYTMIGVCPLLYLTWKLLKRTKIHRSEDVNLIQDLKEIEDYQANYVPTPQRYVYLERK